MTLDQFFWIVSRVAGLASYAALAVALVTGIALRTAVLDWLGSNRALRSLHEYTTVLWTPLAVLNLAALLLDKTSRIGFVDLVLPFHSVYGSLAIGLGALSVDVLVVVTVTAYLKAAHESEPLEMGAPPFVRRVCADLPACGAERHRFQRPIGVSDQLVGSGRLGRARADARCVGPAARIDQVRTESPSHLQGGGLGERSIRPILNAALRAGVGEQTNRSIERRSA